MNLKSFLVLFFISLVVWPVLSKAETSWERIQQEKILRCGYILYPPYLEKDIKTGQLMGPGYDFVQKLGETLGWKIVWAEEVAIGAEVTALISKRIDALCAIFGMYDPAIFPLVSFSDPYFYVKNTLYARSDDARFSGSKTVETLNTPDLTFVGIEGDSTALYAKQLFPKAKFKELPQLSEIGQLFLELQTNKADLIVIEPIVAERAIRHNPSQFREVVFAGELPAYGASLVFPKEAQELKNTVDVTLQYMNANEMIDKIMDAYDPEQKALFRIPRAWRK